VTPEEAAERRILKRVESGDLRPVSFDELRARFAPGPSRAGRILLEEDLLAKLEDDHRRNAAAAVVILEELEEDRLDRAEACGLVDVDR